MRAIGNGIGIPFRRNTGQGVIWPPDLKSALVCWYSPRKQKLTEYDVIESYAEDFTKGNIWPNCAFVFEKVNVALNSETFSFSKSTNIDDLIGKSGITYQTKQSYNGKIIGVGTSSDGDILLIGGQLKGGYIGCHSDFLLFNRTLTQEEIDWVKNKIFKIQTTGI